MSADHTKSRRLGLHVPPASSPGSYAIVLNKADLVQRTTYLAHIEGTLNAYTIRQFLKTEMSSMKRTQVAAINVPN